MHADVTTGGYPPRLRGLAYKAKTIVEETGANNLYLALGTLVWELDGRALRSPAGPDPGRPEPRAVGGRYRRRRRRGGQLHAELLPAGEAAPVHGLVHPRPGRAAGGRRPRASIDAASRRSAPIAHGLPFRVEATADVAILQFAKFRLWKDLDENWATFARTRWSST